MANSLPDFESKTLKNGLQIVVVPMHNNSDVITTDIFYKVGSRNERMGKSGIAHMLEHLNFKSTKNLKAGQFDEIVKGFGGVNNASTGFDYTHYFIKSSSSNLDKSLELFAELMQNLKLMDEEFQPERDVVAEERRWRTDNNPVGYLYFKLFNHVYTYHPYHWTPIGFMDDILNWSIEDIREFHRTYYQPQNAIVLVAGDIESEKVFKATEEHFGEIDNCCEIPEVYAKEPKQDGAKQIVIHKESEVEMVAVTYHIPNFAHEDQPALSAISELLDGGKSSRLKRNLIDKKQLVNKVYANNFELTDPGLFMLFAVCNNGVEATTVEKELLAQIENVKKGKVKPSELEKVKLNIKSDIIFMMENSSNVAEIFGSYFARGNIEPLLSFEKDIDALTIEKIIEVANRYFKPENSSTVILKQQEEA